MLIDKLSDIEFFLNKKLNKNHPTCYHGLHHGDGFYRVA